MTVYAFERNAVVVASAGTGKTHTLVGVLVHVLLGETELGEVSPTRVVATTFSRRAAREIRARLVRELELLASSPASSRYLAELERTREARGLAPRGARALATSARKVLGGIDGVFVGTLHGFALSLLRGYSLEAGALAGIEVAEEADVRARTNAAIVEAIEVFAERHGQETRKLVGLANGLEPLVARIRSTFDAFDELGLRAVSLRVPEGDDRVIERRWDDLVRRVRDVSGVPRFAEACAAFEALGGRTEPALIEGAIEALSGPRKTSTSTPEELAVHSFVESLKGATKRAKLERLFYTYESRHDFAREAEAVRELLVLCEERLEVARTSSEGLGFGEVLGRLARLLETRPDVAEEIGARFDALLVDEFQDTSRLQKRIVELLWRRPGARDEPFSGLSAVRERGLFVVGDRKQSIYGFRGADVSVFAELCIGLAGEPAREKLRVDAGEVYAPERPTADFFPLRVNRRSVPEVLRFVNAFSARAFADDLEKRELFEIEYSPEIEDLVAPEPAALGEGAVTTPRTVWLRPTVREKSASTTRRDEARLVSSVVRDLVAGLRPSALPSDGVGGRGRPVRYKDCAVLALTNDMLDETAYALAESDVPYVLAGKSFYRAREVLDVTALLSLLVDPADRLAAMSVLRGPFAGVSDRTLIALTDPGKGLRRVDRRMLEGPRAALLVEEDRERVLVVIDVVERLGRIVGRVGPGPALREAVRVLRLEETLAALPRGRGKVANVRKLLSLADRESHPHALVSRVTTRAQGTDDEGEAATFSEEDDAVRLLTVHASKGLDFPIVFVPQMGAVVTEAGRSSGPFAVERTSQGAFLATRLLHRSGSICDSPAYERSRAMTLRRERAERKRLLYVAMTRASYMLFPVGTRRVAKSGRSDAHATSGAAVLEWIAAATEADPLFAIEDYSVGPRGVVPLRHLVSEPPPELVAEERSAEARAIALRELEVEERGGVKSTVVEGRSPSGGLTVVGLGAGNIGESVDAPLVPPSIVVGDEPTVVAASVAKVANDVGASERDVRPAALEGTVPRFRTLPIAPTSLQDFHLCPRRFELVHLLALPEHAHLARGARAPLSRVAEQVPCGEPATRAAESTVVESSESTVVESSESTVVDSSDGNVNSFSSEGPLADDEDFLGFVPVSGGGFALAELDALELAGVDEAFDDDSWRSSLPSGSAGAAEPEGSEPREPPEPASPEPALRATSAGPSAPALATRLDAQAEGTRMHRVLERLDAAVFGRDEALEAVSEGLAREGIPREHPRHAPLAKRLGRFAKGAWLAERVARGGTLHRELAFAVHVPVVGSREARAHDGASPEADPPTALFRGSMDLVVECGTEIEVVDYKRARGPGLEPYAFQLELYALAARTLFPHATRIRAGVVFLGGNPEAPTWLEEAPPEDLERRIADVVLRLLEARWKKRFPRVEKTRCDRIHCGFVGRCHPRR